jgi:hypothetical protein
MLGCIIPEEGGVIGLRQHHIDKLAGCRRERLDELLLRTAEAGAPHQMGRAPRVPWLIRTRGVRGEVGRDAGEISHRIAQLPL